MPAEVNSRSATERCTLAGNEARSIGHHAPDAPKPAIVCRATGLTCATASPAGVGTDVGGAVTVVTVGFGELECDDDEHAAATNTATNTVAPTRRQPPSAR